MPNFAALWDEWHENHYVKIFVQKTGDNTAADADGETQTIYQADAYDTKTLPGAVGDLLEITGVQTAENYTERRFRCHTAVLASDQGVTNYPAASSVDSLGDGEQTSPPNTLTATASDVSTSGCGTVVVAASADTQVAEGRPTYTYGSATNLYLQSYTSDYGNERIWVKFDLNGKVPTGATITAATLSLYQWWTYGQGGDMDASVHGCTDDSWTESALSWNTQNTFESTAEGTVTLVEERAKWYEWDVASFVQSEVTNSDGILSFVLKPTTEDSSTQLVYNFDAKEYNSGDKAPSLEVSYEVEAGNHEDVEPTSVAFYYRYSADGVTWNPWTSIGTDSDSSDDWSISSSYGDGYGYYEFYSLATDADGNVEDAPIKADASVRYISGSNTAASVTPTSSIADGTVGTGAHVWLSVTVADSDNDAVGVCFYTESGELIDCVENVATGMTASVAWTSLDDATAYGWYAVVDDGTEASTPDIWSFTTTNTAPSVTSSSSEPGTTDATLIATVSDPDSSQTVDVYFHDDSGTLIGSASGIASGGTAFATGSGLSAETTYNWYVVVDDGMDEYTSTTWTFTTETGAPVPAVPAVDVFGMLATIASLLLAGTAWIRRQRS